MSKGRKGSLGKVITVSFAHLFHDIPTSFLAPVLPLIIDRFGLSMFMAGLLDFFRRLPSLANPFLGLLADRICIRYIVIFTPGVTAVLMSMIGVAPSYILLTLLLFLCGFSTALFHVTAPVMMKHVSAGRIGRGMSFFMVGGELARTLGPLIILGAVSLWGLEGTYRMAPFGIVASIFFYFSLKDVSVRKDLAEKQDYGIRGTVLNLMPFFISITGVLLCRGAMKAALTIYLPTYLTSRGSSLWLAGIGLSVIQFSGAGGTFLAGIISDRIGRKMTLLIITTVSPFLLFLLTVVDGKFTIPVLIITGFFLFGIGPVLLALVHDIDAKRMSFINGIYMTLNFILNSLTVVATGFAADRIGLDLTFRLSAFLALGAVIFAIFLKPADHSGGSRDDSWKAVS